MNGQNSISILLILLVTIAAENQGQYEDASVKKNGMFFNMNHLLLTRLYI